MLPRSWFKHDTTESPTEQYPLQGPNAVSLNPVDANSPKGRPPYGDRSITTALATPHDAVIAELQGHRPDLDTSARIDAESSPSATIPSVGPLERERGAPSPNQAQAGQRSLTASPANTGSPEPIYDPFTGNLAYILSPNSPSSRDEAGQQNNAHFEQAKDELWSRLGQIRELQSEIAAMHAHLEGIGSSDGRSATKGASMGAGGRDGVGGDRFMRGRTRSDTIVEEADVREDNEADGEEWPGLEQEEQERKKARDAEFAGLAQAFEGRHAAIDKIMVKLGALSTSLTAFHALPTPSMDFSAFPSRKNTQESYASSSYGARSPSPPTSPSPLSPIGGTAHVLPNTLQAELEKLEEGKSKKSTSGEPS